MDNNVVAAIKRGLERRKESVLTLEGPEAEQVRLEIVRLEEILKPAKLLEIDVVMNDETVDAIAESPLGTPVQFITITTSGNR